VVPHLGSTFIRNYHPHHKHAPKSEKAQVLEDVDTAVELAACSYLLAPDEEWIEEEYEDEEHIQDLLGVQDIVAAHRHLPHDASAGRHDMDVLEATGAVRRVIDTFGRDPHISSKRQKKGHLHSNILLIDCSFSSDLIPHPGCVCILPSFLHIAHFF